MDNILGNSNFMTFLTIHYNKIRMISCLIIGFLCCLIIGIISWKNKRCCEHEKTKIINKEISHIDTETQELL